MKVLNEIAQLALLDWSFVVSSLGERLAMSQNFSM